MSSPPKAAGLEEPAPLPLKAADRQMEFGRRETKDEAFGMDASSGNWLSANDDADWSGAGWKFWDWSGADASSGNWLSANSPSSSHSLEPQPVEQPQPLGHSRVLLPIGPGKRPPPDPPKLLRGKSSAKIGAQIPPIVMPPGIPMPAIQEEASAATGPATPDAEVQRHYQRRRHPCCLPIAEEASLLAEEASLLPTRPHSPRCKGKCSVRGRSCTTRCVMLDGHGIPRHVPLHICQPCSLFQAADFVI
jgi:hypothetical protein